MLYPYLLLIAEPGEAPRLEPLQMRGWRPTVLVPRQLCLFESIPCAEVRWFELAGFARLQVLRLSPFQRTGASAARRGGHLALWMWDADEVQRLTQAAGGATEGHAPVAEAMFLALPEDGEAVRRCTQAEEHISVEGGALVRSRLAALAPFRVDGVDMTAKEFDWLAARANGLGLEGLGGGVGLFNRGACLLAMAMLGWATFQGAAVWSAARAAESLERQVAERTSAQGANAQLRRELEADQQWLQNYAVAVAELNVPALLEALRPVLEAHGVVVREWTSGTDNVRVVLVTAGGDIRLPELTRDLTAVPGVVQLQLLQHEDLNSATFTFRPEGWIREARSPSFDVRRPGD